MTTGESWNGIMHDCMVTEPRRGCSNAADTCGSPFLATVYFVSFIIFSCFLMLNVFVAVVLKNFETEVANDPRSPHTFGVQVIQEFGQIWAENNYLHGSTTASRMHIRKLLGFLTKLPRCFGCHGKIRRT